jgi:hypothetical protein
LLKKISNTCKNVSLLKHGLFEKNLEGFMVTKRSGFLEKELARAPDFRVGCHLRKLSDFGTSLLFNFQCMKTCTTVLLLGLFLSQAYSQHSYTVVDRGLDWKVLQKTEVVDGTNRVHQYTELATGLNYTNSDGELADASETITILPGGGATAMQGRHHVFFPANIYNGVIEIVTPDGRHLQSRSLGVTYDDGSNTVFIARLKSAVGYLTASNQVTYRDAFDGLKADLVCTYRKGGFESDLVFRQQPPTPDQYGLDASYSTLELVTEFFNTEDPEQIPAGSDDWYGLQDNTLKFGQLTMTHGKAFGFMGTNSSPSTINSQSATPVYKSWQHIGGRTFLIETVPVLDIAENLNALPLQALNEKMEKGGTKKWAANASPITRHSSLADALPAFRAPTACTNQIELALNETSLEPGVVLDYTTVVDGSDTYTFGSGTYFISGTVNLTGTNTIGAGAILKFATNGQIACDTLVCATTVDQPAILTSANDDSVGDIIEGSTGMPIIYQTVAAPGFADPFGSFNAYVCFPDEWPSYLLRHLRVKYAQCAFWEQSDKAGPDEADDSQFIDCGTVFMTVSSGWTLNNDLFSGCQAIFSEENGLQATAVNVTADHCWTFINDDSLNNGEISFTNSLITDVTTMMAVTNWSGWVPYTWPAGVFLDHTVMASTTNGFIVYLSVSSSQIASAAGIYETAANANYYLAAGSSYRNVGTTNIDPGLLAELRTMTTYAPQDGGYPDTDVSSVDLGYHYSVNEDSDFDGLPDWWEWKYFHSFDHKGGDLDAYGRTLSYVYQHRLSPFFSGTLEVFTPLK